MNFINVFFATLLGINELTFTISGELLLPATPAMEAQPASTFSLRLELHRGAGSNCRTPCYKWPRDRFARPVSSPSCCGMELTKSSLHPLARKAHFNCKSNAARSIFFYPHIMFLPWRRRMSWEAAMDVDVCVNVGWQNIKFILFPPLIHSWAISLIVISSFSVHKDEHFTSEATSTSKTSLAYSNSILVVARLIWPALLLNLRFHSSVSQRN